MPFILRRVLDQIPLPSLRYYTLISSALLVGQTVYFHHLMQLNASNLSADNNATNHSELQDNPTLFHSNAKPFSWSHIQSLAIMLLSQSLSRLMFVNTIYCSLVLLARKLQEFIFGDLRPVELQRIKDKFWNYAFYKFCFLFGVLGVESFNELSLWISWFFSLAFALVFCQLVKDRFELLSVSISAPRHSLTRILYLLIGLLCFCLGLFAVCCLVGLKYGGVSIFFFMLAEISLLTLDTTYLLVKYIYIQQQQPSSERRSYIFYYLEFSLDVSALTIDILYHLQMLFYHQTFMSMSSLILFMQLKPLFNELTQRLKRHKSYRLAMTRMERKYPLLTRDDLEEKARKQNHVSSLEEICSICWEKFEKARCLPCGHLFHQNCLRSWLEQDSTCPICRVSLHEDTAQSAEHPRFWPATTQPRPAANPHDLPIVNDQRRGRNHLFHFDGHRYSAWLPSFSIVINHNFPFRFARARLTGVQLTSMAQSVQQIFPQIPFEIILSDLQRTQSIDATIENIVEQRIQFEPQHHEEEDEEEDEEQISEFEEPLDASSDSEETNRRDPLSTPLHTIEDNTEAFTWPLNPTLPFDHRKQLLISYMRRQYLERERRLQSSTSHRPDQ